MKHQSTSFARRPSRPRRRLAAVLKALEPLECRTLLAASGLVAAYSFDEGTGTALNDVSGTGNNGTIANATWSGAGKNGGALTFNGTNSWVTIADSASLRLTNGMTLEAWVNPTSRTGFESAILKERSGGLSYALYTNDNSSRPPAVYINKGGSDVSAVGTANLTLSAWSHLAATYDGSNLRFYVNGALVRTKAVTGNIANTVGGALRLGGNSVWGEYFAGKLDDVRVYNRALSLAEVQTDMNTPVAPPAPDTTAPTVSMTSPADGATATGTASLAATAADNVGVASVQFLLNGNPLGSPDTTAPYSLSWDTTTVANGTYALAARAVDAAGNATTSAPVNVTVNNVVDVAAPTVSVTAPADGTTVSGTAVAVTANASDDVGVVGVQFQLDGANLGAEDTAAPYTLNWNTTTAANGGHKLTAIARDAAGHVTTSAIVNVTVANADTTAPTVSLSAPANGTTVSGSAVTVSANASDNVGVTSVQFLLDGNPLGAPDTAAPYGITWDSTGASNGIHTLAARAFDAAGNFTTSATRSVTVSNISTDPAVVGQWSGVIDFPIVAMNVVLLKTGKILMWDGGPDCIGAISATIYDPATGAFTPVPSETQQEVRDIFCSAQTVLADGRVLVAGGHECVDPSFVGSAIGNLFDPVTQTWTKLPNMNDRRWYPTATTLPDGRALVTAGSATSVTDYDPIPEIYDEATNTWTKLTGASKVIPNYPFMFVLPDGRVLAAGSDEAKMATSVLDLTTRTWTTVDPTILDAGSAVMYLPGKIMKAGSSYLSPPADNGGSVPSSANTYVLDMTSGAPAWKQTQSMANPRTHLNLTVLPDGNVLATGGSTDIGGVNAAHAVLAAEEWNPTTQTWTTMSSEQRPRLYHSTATLLPDGRVLVAGGGHNYYNNLAEYSAEIYSPAYLFKGARPTITSSPQTAEYNSDFFVGTPDGARIASVSLIRNGATTHSFDMDQRLVPLTFQQTAGGLTVRAPIDANTAPPGTYMLFIVDSNGVPSIAPFVQVVADTHPPTAPANPAATGSVNAARVTWDASTDNGTVVRYDVYRSTSPNFVPSASNRVGQSASTTFLDSGVAPGTYYYELIAVDASGNASAPSLAAQATVTASPVHMIQHAASGFESAVSNISLSFPSSVTAGDFLIVTGTAARPRHSITITDSAGNTFVPAVSGVTDASQDVTAYVWYVVNAKGGPDTITLTPTGGADAMEIHISEWSGISKTAPVDQTSFATGTGTQITSGTQTTTQNGELIFGYTFPNKDASAGAGFTGLSLINGDLDEYAIQGFAGPVAATFTQQSDLWLGMMVTFRPEDPDLQPPTPPASLSASGGIGVANLSWTAATDNVAVDHYNVYRSTSPDFVPSAANQVAQVTGTTYTDAGLATGTYYYYVIAQDPAGNVSAASNLASATVTADVTPPTVTVTGPASGSTVSSAVNLTASASDDVGVASVQFYVDGAAFGSPDTTAPYSVSWNTASTSNGQHTITARAFDAAGNATTSADVIVTVANTALPGLIGAWGFDDVAGATASDSSGHNLTGTLSNTAWTSAGKFGGALMFNGTNSWVTVADNNLLDLTTGMTLEAWVKPTTLNGWTNVIMKERGTTGLNYALYASDNTGQPPAGYVHRSSDVSALGTSALTLGAWAHLATTYDGANLRLYVNGTLVRTKAVTGSLANTANALRIGGDAPWGEYFNGLIDEVRVYNRALSQTEVQTDMASAVNPAGNSVVSFEAAMAPAFAAPMTTLAAATTTTTTTTATTTTATPLTRTTAPRPPTRRKHPTPVNRPAGAPVAPVFSAQRIASANDASDGDNIARDDDTLGSVLR